MVIVLVVSIVYVRFYSLLHTVCFLEYEIPSIPTILFLLVLSYKHLFSFEQSHLLFCQYKIEYAVNIK